MFARRPTRHQLSPPGPRRTIAPHARWPLGNLRTACGTCQGNLTAQTPSMTRRDRRLGVPSTSTWALRSRVSLASARASGRASPPPPGRGRDTSPPTTGSGAHARHQATSRITTPQTEAVVRLQSRRCPPRPNLLIAPGPRRAARTDTTRPDGPVSSTDRARQSARPTNRVVAFAAPQPIYRPGHTPMLRPLASHAPRPRFPGAAR